MQPAIHMNWKMPGAAFGRENVALLQSDSAWLHVYRGAQL